MLSMLVSAEGGFAHLLQTVPWIQEAVAYADLQEHHLYHLMATLLWLDRTICGNILQLESYTCAMR